MKHGNQKRDEKAAVRRNLWLTPTLKQKLTAAAKRRGIPDNELIRQLLEREL